MGQRKDSGRNRILVATDFSARSERALRRAGMLARSMAGALTVVHVVDDDRPGRIVELEVREAGTLLEEQVGSLPELAGLACRYEVVTGDPFDGILRAGAETAADLIVMGSHRKHLLRDVFIGTTIERVVRRGPCPVLMVNSPAAGPYGSVLVPVDMSDASARALEAADGLGLLEDARVVVAHAFLAMATGPLYIADAPKERIAAHVAEEQRRADVELGAFLEANHVLDRDWQRHVREGDALEVIGAAVETLRPDLVVVGTHGRSGIARIFLGSVTESLLRALETDILAVPPRRPAGTGGDARA